MRIVGRLPLAPPRPCPRDALGVAALAFMKPTESEIGRNDERAMPAKAIRMKRSLGGRHHVLYVRVTEEEDRRIRTLAAQEGLSAQRFLLETALSGSTQSAALRRHAAVEMRAARAILRGVANNLNQLTKWTNANHSLPDSLDGIVEDLGRAVRTVDSTSARLANAFAEPVADQGKPTAPS